ncbi:unnamed protein product [Eruca vesicaria subsp. sativa]|uniref:AT-hook motif nuclear-localized protein n=1 Tax=Eruca vesicaria subsp. sativa TaxID=29727 RepID=A0ABC8ITI7_ERUVS|nr:unnamed protein product [Eruca vesicaria subsp. sativa]
MSLSGSYIRGEHGGKTGGLSVCLSSSDGQIFGGGVGGLLKVTGPVQVILGTFQLERKWKLVTFSFWHRIFAWIPSWFGVIRKKPKRRAS